MSKRSNPNINDPVDHYRFTIFILFINSMIRDLTSHFSDEIIVICDLEWFLPNVLTRVFGPGTNNSSSISSGRDCRANADELHQL